MTCQKVCKQGRDDIIVKVNLLSLHLFTLQLQTDMKMMLLKFIGLFCYLFIYLFIYYYYFYFFIFIKTNLCNAPVNKKIAILIANINLVTVVTIQQYKDNDSSKDLISMLVINNTVMHI